MSDKTEADAITAVLTHAPHVFSSGLRPDDLSASLLSGGVSNLNYRVRIKGSDKVGVVVRFRPQLKDDDPEATSIKKQFSKYVGGRKLVEVDVMTAASAAGVGPELLYYGEEGNTMITREVNARPLTQADLKDPAMLERVLKAMNRLHRLEIPESKVPAPTWKEGYRVMPVIDFMLNFMREKGYTKYVPADMDEISAALTRIDAFIASSASGPHSGYTAICHTDPVPANILACPDGSIVFVDFEFASRTHPDYDIAKVAASSMFSAADDKVLQEIWTRIGGGFGDGSRPGSALARFQAFKIFEIAFRGLWVATQCYESTLPFEASWSVAKTWPEATDLLFKELRERMASPEMEVHLAKLVNVRKCIVPVAGLASRIYPASKAVSKCMFPIYDPVSGLLKPLIHHTVEEALAAGIEEICLVVNPGDSARIRDYFESPTDPDIYASKGREEHARIAGGLQDLGKRITIVVQGNAEGFGDAIMKAQDFVNGEPFAVIMGDHAFLTEDGQPPVIKQLRDAFLRSQETTYGVGLGKDEELSHTAIFCGTALPGEGRPLYKATKLKAYPTTPEEARKDFRSDGVPDGQYLCTFGMFVHMPALYSKMEALKAASLSAGREGAGGFVDDALRQLVAKSQTSLVHIGGQRLDIGMPLVYADTLGVLAEAGRKRRRTA